MDSVGFASELFIYVFYYQNFTQIFTDLTIFLQSAQPSWYATWPTGPSTGLAWASSLPPMWTLSSAPMLSTLWPPSALTTVWSQWNGTMRTCTDSWTTWSWRKWSPFLSILCWPWAEYQTTQTTQHIHSHAHMAYAFITCAKEVMFVCLSVCLITR